MNSPSIFDPVSLRADLTDLEDENARMLATITAIREIVGQLQPDVEAARAIVEALAARHADAVRVLRGLVGVVHLVEDRDAQGGIGGWAWLEVLINSHQYLEAVQYLERHEGGIST